MAISCKCQITTGDSHVQVTGAPGAGVRQPQAHTSRKPRRPAQAVAVRSSDRHTQVQGVASHYGRRRAACTPDAEGQAG